MATAGSNQLTECSRDPESRGSRRDSWFQMHIASHGRFAGDEEEKDGTRFGSGGRVAAEAT